tara:strand:- start:31 stop:489 length:459 start_codon:yes stop_codon:yes gene_type:complete
MRIKIVDIILVLLPALVGYGTQAFCNLGKSAGAGVKFRPPAWAFGLIWAILFILFGLSWAIALRSVSKEEKYKRILVLVLYGLTTLLLGIWIIVYGCMGNKKAASWVLILVIAAAVASFAQGCVISKTLISPLIAWALFALIMNTTEVQQAK